jgi:SAM-dependent methyltransferase
MKPIGKKVPSFFYILHQRLAGRNFLYEFYYRGKKTLDIGCGDGLFMRFDKSLIHGFDSNGRAIRDLQASGFNAKEGSVISMPFEAASFEMAQCHNVIEHLEVDEAYKMLLEAGRILKPGGLFVLSSEIPTRKFWGTFGHVKPYPPGAVLKLLRKQSREEFEGLDQFEYAGVFYLGDYYRNKLMYLVSAISGYYTRLFRREYFLVLRKK